VNSKENFCPNYVHECCFCTGGASPDQPQEQKIWSDQSAEQKVWPSQSAAEPKNWASQSQKSWADLQQELKAWAELEQIEGKLDPLNLFGLRDQ
jgi:hypothetical protein